MLEKMYVFECLVRILFFIAKITVLKVAPEGRTMMVYEQSKHVKQSPL